MFCFDEQDEGKVSKPFTGVLDGNGYVIDGYKQDCGGAYSADSACFLGLFGYIGRGGVVKNVTLRNYDLNAGRLSGFVAGVNLGLIQNVVIERNCTLYSNYKESGVVGYNDGKVENVVSYVDKGASYYGDFDVASSAQSGKDATSKNIFVAKNGKTDDLTNKLADGWFYIENFGTVYGNDAYKNVLDCPETMVESNCDSVKATSLVNVYQKTEDELVFMVWLQSGAARENLIKFVSKTDGDYRIKLEESADLNSGDKFTLGVKAVGAYYYFFKKEITVSEPAMVSAAYTGASITVMQNTVLNINAIKLDITYSDGTTGKGSVKKIEGLDSSAEVGSVQSVKFYYDDGESDYVLINVTVVAVSGAVAVNVSATKKAAVDKIVINVGDTFDILDYYDVTVSYSDATNKTVASGDINFSVSAVASGLNDITITYIDGAAASVTINNVVIWAGISSLNDFKTINGNLAGYYVLLNDLDFNGESYKIGDAPRNIVGDNTTIDYSGDGNDSSHPPLAFVGKFDGGGFTIKNWATTYESGWVPNYFAYSMFAYIGVGGEVGNFTLSNFSAKACNQHGFVASLNKGKIYDVTIDASCSILSHWGSVGAYAWYNGGSVENCSCAVVNSTETDNGTEPALPSIGQGNQPV